MLAQHFVAWCETANTSERCAAVALLTEGVTGRKFLPKDARQAEAALIFALDDPSPRVRRMIAEGVAASDRVSRQLVRTLAADIEHIAVLVAGRSPVLEPQDLVELVGATTSSVRIAIARRADLHGSVAAVLALAVGVLFTGAFHEDGLADTADGLGGGQTQERRLEIMKDSRVGTYGVCALVLVLGLKVAVLASTQAAAAILLAAHGLGRAAAVVVMRVTPYAPSGEAGKWKPVPQGVRTGEVLVALLIAAWPLALLPLGAALLGLAGGAVLAIAMALLGRRLIGGHTGDVLGAVEQLFEVGFLLGAAAVL